MFVIFSENTNLQEGRVFESCGSQSCPLLFVVHAGQEPLAEEEPKFNPFTGTGRRLDGKPLKTQPPPVSSSAPQDRRSNISGGGTATTSSSSSQSSKNQTQGKLVFGSNANRSKDAPKVCLQSLT